MAESAAPLLPPAAHPPPPLQSRRVSFRQSLTDASLPLEYLDQLEQKRKQLDESIHKYIASKEREYKNFERELEQRARHARGGGGRGSGAGVEIVGTLGGRRRTSQESTTLPSSEPDREETRDPDGHSPNAQRLSAVHALLASGSRRDSDSAAVEGEDGGGTLTERKAALAGLRDRRVSFERDKDLVGLFTPPFLPALESSQNHTEPRGHPERTASAPAAISLTDVPGAPGANDGEHGPTRALSDPSLHSSMQAKAKRPAQLAIASRTSSSGSSADGRLTSAMKSPTHKERPIRKRVSLAVGDCIVAPSDSVPVSLSSNNNTPSHSRSRSSVLPERSSEAVVHLPEGAYSQSASMADAQAANRPISPTPSTRVTGDAGAPSKSASGVPPPITTTTIISAPVQSPASTIDPDGDFFDLEEDADGGLVRYDVSDPDEDLRTLHNDNESPDHQTSRTANPSAHALAPDERYDYDPEAGLVPSSEPIIPLSFRAGSIGASKQPVNPGFRRPSISHDPIFAGADYAAAARKAAEDEIYGSSYSRHSTKGSFTAGSLGESFMERNAAEMRMRAANALARREAEVKS
nr:hypothetical protein CFP56_24438 [Quercus suber]